MEVHSPQQTGRASRILKATISNYVTLGSHNQTFSIQYMGYREVLDVLYAEWTGSIANILVQIKESAFRSGECKLLPKHNYGFKLCKGVEALQVLLWC